MGVVLNPLNFIRTLTTQQTRNKAMVAARYHYCFGVLLVLVLLQLVHQTVSTPDVEEDVAERMELADRGEELERLLQMAQNKIDDKRSRSAYALRYRRSCIRRGGRCDQRPKDCCNNSSCRCNLWGTNCRCSRMGLFQQWGK